MKRHGYIFEKIIDMDNLKLAHRMARRDKSFYKEVKMVDSNPDYYLKKIQDMLINQTYSINPNDYTMFTKNDKGKIREIFKLDYFPHRVIQWALMLQIEGILLKSFTSDTYSSIPNRGIHLALRKLHNDMKDREGTQYCLKLDIKKFYPNINQSICKQLFRRKFKDKNLIWLMDTIIDSMGGEKGIAIGSLFSQWAGNFYLSYFDHWLKENKKIKYYYRYCDDCVILHHDKQFLHKLKKEIEKYLSVNLDLTLKKNWQVFPTYIRGVDFVGYRSFGDYTLLRKTTSKQLKRKMRKLKKKNEFLSKNDMSSVNSYRGWMMYANAYNLEKKYIIQLLNRYRKECDEMKAQSTISPNPIWIQYIKRGIATVRLRKNIVETIREEQIIYEYDEIIINIADRNNLEEYVTNNFEELYSAALNKIKEDKIKELNQQCEQAILDTFSSIVDGVTYSFSCDREAQANFDKSENALTKNYVTTVDWTAYDVNGNVVRLTLDWIKFEPVYKDHLTHINTNVSKFRDTLMPQVLAATDKASVDAIVW